VYYLSLALRHSFLHVSSIGTALNIGNSPIETFELERLRLSASIHIPYPKWEDDWKWLIRKNVEGRYISGHCPCIFMRKTTKIRSQDNQTLGKESIPGPPQTQSRSVRYSIGIFVPASCTLSTGILALQASGLWKLPVTYVTCLCGMVPDTSAFHLTCIQWLTCSYILNCRIAEDNVMFIRISSCGLFHIAVSISDYIASNGITNDWWIMTWKGFGMKC
jgi:hypothetical protein